MTRTGPSCVLPGAALLLALVLPACQAAREVDQALRRVDVLDRVFEPERYRQARAAPLPAPPPPAPEPVAEPPVEPPAQFTPPQFAPPQPARPGDLPKEPETEVLRAAETVPAPAPAPTPEAPPPDPAVRRAALLRQNPWLSRFWSELTQPQQARVARRVTEGDPAAAWDRMGLAERVRLIYGERA